LEHRARAIQRAAYDDARHRLVVFATTDGSTWTFDSAEWSRQHPPPPFLYFTSMVSVPTSGEVVLLGGKVDNPAHDINQTWIWDGQDRPQAT